MASNRIQIDAAELAKMQARKTAGDASVIAQKAAGSTAAAAAASEDVKEVKRLAFDAGTVLS
jgi:hypothetical protein